MRYQQCLGKQIVYPVSFLILCSFSGSNVFDLIYQLGSCLSQQ